MLHPDKTRFTSVHYTFSNTTKLNANDPQVVITVEDLENPKQDKTLYVQVGEKKPVIVGSYQSAAEMTEAKRNNKPLTLDLHKALVEAAQNHLSKFLTEHQKTLLNLVEVAHGVALAYPLNKPEMEGQ
jgi:hypothetical protein